MIHERRASAHTNYTQLGRLRRYREQEPVDDQRDLRPFNWSLDDDTEAYPLENAWRSWARRHPVAVDAIGWAIALTWGFIMGLGFGS
jgi:hypothetical protein